MRPRFFFSLGVAIATRMCPAARARSVSAVAAALVATGLTTGIATCLAAAPARAAPVQVARLDDARGDDTGPGSYQYPTNPQLYPRGALDLRSLEVLVDGDDVIFKVTLGAAVRAPAMPPRRQIGSTEIALDNGVYVQNVDIYMDTRGGAGFTETVPGRNVLVRADDAWDAAVVLTPQPAATRSLVKDWEPAPHVVFAQGVRAEGPTLIARVPRSVLGDVPQKDWGYCVVVTAAVWEYTFALVDRTLAGKTMNAFTMPVAPVPEALVVGGAPLSRFAPAVLDLIAPAGTTQAELLRSNDSAIAYKQLPMVYPHGARPAAIARAGSIEATPRPQLDLTLSPSLSLAVNEAPLELVVADVSGDLVILSRPPEVALAPHRVGLVLGDTGTVEGAWWSPRCTTRS